MRTGRLRRWLLRGALLAAAVTPAIGADAATADEWTWGDAPTVSTQDAGPGVDESVNHTDGEWTWGNAPFDAVQDADEFSARTENEWTWG